MSKNFDSTCRFFGERTDDANGCRNNNALNQKVYVSTTPVFTGSAAFDDEICLGQSTTITGVSAPVPFVRECAPPVSGTTFLPDGSGVSYQTTVPVDCFPFGSTITSASQITSVCLEKTPLKSINELLPAW